LADYFRRRRRDWRACSSPVRAFASWVDCGARAVSMKVAQRVLEKSGWDMQQIEEEPQQMGQPREIEVEEVSALTAFQKDSRIREKLDANNEQIIFDKETGALRNLDETGRELEN
jgi:predicted acyl esterase